MKKWMKACMVTGLSCMIVGAVLYGAGYVFGGKTYVRTADLNHFGTSGASEQTASSILPKTQVDDYRNLDIHVDMLDLNVVRSEDDHFYISYEAQSKNGKPAVTYSVENDTLTVNERETKGHYVNIDVDFLADLLNRKEERQQKNLITLYVPERTKINHVKIDGDMSDIRLSSITVTSGSLQTYSGDVVIDDCDIRHFGLKTDMGDVEIERSNLDTCSFSSGSGDFDFTGITWKENTEIISDMGAVDIEGTPEVLTKLAIQVTTDMGDIDVSERLNGKVMENETDNLQTFEQKVEKATGSLTIETNSGDISMDCD